MWLIKVMFTCVRLIKRRENRRRKIEFRFLQSTMGTQKIEEESIYTSINTNLRL